MLRPSRSRQSGDDEGRGDDVAQGEAEGHVEAVLGAVRAQQADVLGAPDVEVERRPEVESHFCSPLGYVGFLTRTYTKELGASPRLRHRG